VGVAVSTGVGVEVGRGGVEVGSGVIVGPKICPAPQPEMRRVITRAAIRYREVFIEISLVL
jgi:hypothetical protein